MDIKHSQMEVSFPGKQLHCWSSLILTHFFQNPLQSDHIEVVCCQSLSLHNSDESQTTHI